MELGSERFSIRVKDILKDVAGDASARGRTPAIREVLQGNQLLREDDLEIEAVDGPPSKQRTTVVVHYWILHPRRWSGDVNAEKEKNMQATEVIQESPKGRARQLTDKMAGLLKDEMAATEAVTPSCGGSGQMTMRLREANLLGRDAVHLSA